MSRALILIAAVILFREFLPRQPRRSPTAISPYMNSLDGLMSAKQISLVMEELHLQETLRAASPSSKGPPATAA